MIERHWSDPRFHLLTREHFYHVGSTEDLRHPMIEALITNFPGHTAQPEGQKTEQLAFFDKPIPGYPGKRSERPGKSAEKKSKPSKLKEHETALK